MVKAGDPVKGDGRRRSISSARRCRRGRRRGPGRDRRRARRRPRSHDALPDGDRWEFVGSVERRARPVAGDEPGGEDLADRRAEPRSADQARRRRAVPLHARGGRRGRVAPAHREPRQRDRPSRRLVHRHPAPQLLPRSEGRSQDRTGQHLADRPGGRRGADRDQADAGAVEQRPPRRRQRLLHLGDREEARARRLVDGDERRLAGAVRSPARRAAAISSSRRPRARSPAATR